MATKILSFDTSVDFQKESLGFCAEIYKLILLQRILQTVIVQIRLNTEYEVISMSSER